ncbi:hypothetical protein EYF80_022120 [Liparis tanakae]|uniref:Uncharacterized protein n=1 Tax=Liparis tanakae TaxID=230148 RepID=A0A4Z2HP80_9TELE|nr:hypothetical protein EYF80_022120 [Liparis tanakae]
MACRCCSLEAGHRGLVAVGLPQDENISAQNESQKHQREAGPAGQVAPGDVGKQVRAARFELRGTPPADQRQEGDENGGAPEDQQTQQGPPAGQQRLVAGGLLDAKRRKRWKSRKLVVKKQLAKTSAKARLAMKRYDGRCRREAVEAITPNTRAFSSSVTGPARKQMEPMAVLSALEIPQFQQRKREDYRQLTSPVWQQA